VVCGCWFCALSPEGEGQVEGAWRRLGICSCTPQPRTCIPPHLNPLPDGEDFKLQEFRSNASLLVGYFGVFWDDQAVVFIVPAVDDVDFFGFLVSEYVEVVAK